MPVPAYFNTSPVNGGSSLTINASPVGGVIYDFVGLNNTRLTAFFNGDDLPAFTTTTNGIQLLKSSTLSARSLSALGGGFKELAVRFTVFDGDVGPGGTYNDGYLTFNDILQAVNLGNVQTYSHDTSGDTGSNSIQQGYPNQVTATGWALVTDSALLATIYSSITTNSGKLDLKWQQVGGGGNVLNFQTGVSSTLLATPAVNPEVAPIVDLLAASDSGISNSDKITSNITPTLSGVTAPNDNLQIFSGATLLGTATADASGNWSFTFSTALTAGSYNVQVKAVDGSNTVIASSNTLALTIDTISNISAPDLDAASDTGAFDTDNFTGDTTPTLTGVAEPNVTVTLLNGSSPFGTATADAFGDWSFTPASPLVDGVYQITASATDVAGNTATSGALSFTIATSAPAPSSPDLDADSDTGTFNTDNITSDTTPTFKGIAATNSTVTILSNGSSLGTALADSLGNWSFTPSTPLVGGTYNITAKITDAVGNISSESAPLPITISTTKPSIPTAAPDLDAVSDTGISDTDNITADTTPIFVGAPGSGTAGQIVKIYADGVAVGNGTIVNDGSWSVTTSSLTAGDRVMTYTITDVAGNESSPSPSLNVTIDATAPTTPISAPDLDAGSDTGVSDTDNLTGDVTPTFVGAPGSGTAGQTVQIYADGAAIGSGTVINDGSWSVTTSPLSAGPSSITYTFSDAAGNESASSPELIVTVNASNPNTPTLAPDLDAGSDTGVSNTDNITSDTTPTFTGASGNGPAGQTVKLYTDGEVIGSGSVAGDGSWSVTTLPLSEGDLNITYTFTDSAGNESSASPTLAIAIDTLVPPVPSNAPDLDAASDTGISSTDNVTTDQTPTFKGTNGTAGQLVKIYNGETSIGQGEVSGDGSWTVTSSVLPVGAQAITYTYSSKAGNESQRSPVLNVKIESVNTTIPKPPVLDPESNSGSGTTKDGSSLTKDSTPKLTGDADPGSTIQVFIDDKPIGTSTVDASGKWTFNPTVPLPDGTYKVTVKATSPSGVVSDISPKTSLTIDTKPASVQILDFGDTIRDSSVNAINFKFNEAVKNLGLSEIVLTLKGQPVSLEGAALTTTDNQTWSLSNIPGFTTKSGEYQITVKPGKVTDLAGNPLEVGDSDSWITGYTSNALPAIRIGGKIGFKRNGDGSNNLMGGGQRRDILRGGGGKDRILGKGGNDQLSGGKGNDRLHGGKGKDSLLGGAGADRLNGSKGNDRLNGGSGNDRLLGGSGDDVLVGGTGKDTLVGGAGKDTYLMSSLKEKGDQVTGFNLVDDLIDLRAIFKGAQFKAENRFAQYHKFIQLTQVGANTEVQIDTDGSGSGTAFTTLMTLQNVPIGNVSSTNFVVG